MERGGFRTFAGGKFPIVTTCILGLTFAAAHASAQQQVTEQPTAQAPKASQTDASREDLANLDRFLDSHPILERELGSNPSLINDAEYVQKEPDLQIFLEHHPDVKTQLQRDPQYLARRVNFAELTGSNHPGVNARATLDQEEADQLNGFFNTHEDLRQLLKQNPALINDSTFLASHPDLQTFVRQHPRAREEFVENPRYFIAPSTGPRSAPAEGTAPSRPKSVSVKAATPEVPTFDFSVTPEDIARMDQFLEDNPKIAKDLGKDPLLVTNHKYLDHHHDLRRFFDEHVRVREAFAESPRYFVPSNGLGAPRPPLESNDDRRLANRDLAEMANFLHKHRDIAKRAESNPLVLQDLDYLRHHGDLREFLDEHPHIQIEIEEHPHYFMQREEEFRKNENLEVENHK
jgi:hypothetical protein